MKLLFLHDKDLSRGAGAADGVAVYVGQAARALEEAGHEVELVDFRPPPADPRDRQRIEGFRHRYRRASARALLDVAREFGPELIHVQSVTTLHPRLERELAAASPIVWTLHDVSPFCFRRNLLDANDTLCERPIDTACVTRGCYKPGALEPLAGDLLRIATHRRTLRMLCNATRVAVPSAFIRQVATRNGLPGERIEVLPLFTRFAPGELPPRRQEGRPRILYAGRLTRDKGADCLVEALVRLRDESWIAELVGDGPLSDELRGRVDSEGLADRIVFRGSLEGDALDQSLQNADIGVVPSRAPESFALVGPEAMAHGLAMVGSRAGGICEWLEDGVTGLAFDRGSAQDLAASLRRLLRSPDLVQRLRAAGHERVKRRFGVEQHVKGLVDFYSRALGTDGKQPE